MFASPLSLAEKYDYLAPKFRAAYAFLARADLASLPEGAYPVTDGVVANVQRYTTLPWEEVRFESHKHHFDIQYVISGCERFGIVNDSSLCPDGPYDPALDVVFYKEPASSGSLLLTPGDLVIVSPEDGHKPRCQDSAPVEVKKVVVKVDV